MAPERPNEAAQRLLVAEEHDVFLSVASAWEISIKYNLRKLVLPSPPSEYIAEQLEKQGIIALPVRLNHVVRVATLPAHHSDPFDRLLIAQSQAESLVLLTADKAIKSYEVEVFWAG